LPDFRQFSDMAPPGMTPILKLKAQPKSAATGGRAMKHMRRTIIVTSILLGMSGAISLASPYKGETPRHAEAFRY
jgi:hypothetical protein